MAIDEDVRLDEVPVELEPPAEVREAVLARLRDRGLVEAAPVRARLAALRWAAMAAAIVLAFAVGRATASRFPSRALVDAWALMLYELPSAATQGLTEGELVDEYAAWADEARRRGDLLIAERLGEGQWVETPGAGGLPTGLFLVRARDRVQAMEIARTSPHHLYGGPILVQQVVVR